MRGSFVPIAASLMFIGGGVSAQSVKLNGSMARPYRGEVEEVRASPDGAWTLFEAYTEAGSRRLFSVPSKGGTPVVLDVQLPGWWQQIEISPDSRHVVYSDGLVLRRVPIDGSRGATVVVADEGPFQFSARGTHVVYNVGHALFSVALEGGGAPVRLTPPFVAGGAVSGFHAGVAGRLPERVVYLADAETDGVDEVFSVLLDASAAPVKLNGPFAAFSDAWWVDVAPGAERVIFLADAQHDGAYWLFSAPIDGSGAAVALSDAARIRNSLYIRISPDARRVVFLAEPETLDVFELLSVPIDGSALPVKLNPALVPGGDVGAFEIAPASDRVVYLADQEVNGATELYSAPIDGSSAAVELDHVLQPGEEVWSFALSAARVAYWSVIDYRTSASIYSAPIAGGEEPLLLSGSHSAGSMRLAPDGTRVAFVGLEPVGIHRGLYGVAIDGSAEPRLLDAGGRGLLGFGGDSALYLADRDLEFVFDLYSVPLDGGSTVPLSHPMAALDVADIVSFDVAPEGERCVFVVSAWTCDCDDSGAFELHAAGVAPLAPDTLVADGCGGARFSPDGAWLVFVEQLDDGEDFGRLFSAPADGSLAPIELAVDASWFQIMADGSAVVFMQSGPPAGLYRRPIDGSSPATPLALGAVEGLALSPAGSRVVYLRHAASVFELFSVPVDGSGVPVQLNDVTSPLGDGRYPFAITPDGERVYYWTDQESNAVLELFSVPIDGSAPPTKLSGTLVPGGDVVFDAGTAVSADSARLVYRADALVDNVIELFSVPIDGSAPPVRLNAPLPAGGGIFEFAIAGARVVYRAEQLADEVVELFSVPIDATTPPVRLNAPLVAGGDVATFEGLFQPAFVMSSDGTRVAYVADQRANDVYELFGVAADGSDAPRRLGGPSVVGADVRRSFRITSDGKDVLYLADDESDETVELYVASLDGGKGRKVSAPLVPGGDVATSPAPQITPDGRWILYAADQDVDTIQELYRVPLTAVPRASSARPPAPNPRVP